MATTRAEMGSTSEVTLRYWAAARAATGVASDTVPVDGSITLGDLRASALALHPTAHRQLAVCSVLVDDLPVSTADPGSFLVAAGSTVEFLPPFAGG